MKRYQVILLGAVLVGGIGLVMNMDFTDKIRDEYQIKCSGGVVFVDRSRVLCTKSETTVIGVLK